MGYFSSKADWKANWIWHKEDGPPNTWMCMRKTFDLAALPEMAEAFIAADSKYYLWINGEQVVFEGGLNRGPKPGAGYYDVVDIRNVLQEGFNTIAILVWYWGNEGRNSIDSNKGGLVFQFAWEKGMIQSDSSWKIKKHPAYHETQAPYPAYLYGGHNIGFTAGVDSSDWLMPGYDDSEWEQASEKGVVPCLPWGPLYERTIPLIRFSCLKDYPRIQIELLDKKKIITAQLPYGAHITPAFKIKAIKSGEKIDIRTDRYEVHGGPGDEKNVYNAHRTEYITRQGIQEFESLDWLFGEQVIYTVPEDIEMIAVQYRETGYDTAFTGAFTCSDDFFNELYEKCKRTLYVCMRDNFMDCPDRERGQWIGDVSSQVPQVFYTLDRKADQLVLKAIYDFIGFEENGILKGNVPGAHSSELPAQSLNAVSDKGMILSYYMNTGNVEVLKDAYPIVKAYLKLWKPRVNGLISMREGNWQWYDHGEGIDKEVLENTWYYMALKAAKYMAVLTGNTADIEDYEEKLIRMEKHFDDAFWRGDGYRSGMFHDDRANAMAVLSGLASEDKWETIRQVLQTVREATPYMEGYVLEALFKMGYGYDGFVRMKERYAGLVRNENTTLWEDFNILGTKNHAWSGGPLTVLARYAAGVDCDLPGYERYHVLPNLVWLDSLNIIVPSIKGKIIVDIRKTTNVFELKLISPPNTTAVVGLPKNVFDDGNKSITQIKAADVVIWEKGRCIGEVDGVIWKEEDARYYLLEVKPGSWYFILT